MLPGYLEKFAKKAGFKKKQSIYYDSLGFFISEKEIRDCYEEISRILNREN